MVVPAAPPIGVFDSGVGGLSVLREVRAQLPAATLHYVADSGHAPYGDKAAAYVLERAERIVDFFVQQQASAVVVACNTVTGLHIERLRQRYPSLPLVAIEPAVKPAVAATRSAVVGVLATHNTVHSPGLARLIAAHAGPVRVLAQACPGWVELVERGCLDGPEAEAAVAPRLQALLAQGADVLVLGCTHYPFLRPLIERLAARYSPQPVQVLDPAAAVARELVRRLHAAGAAPASTPAAAGSAQATTRFWASGALADVAPVMALLYEPALQVQALPV